MSQEETAKPYQGETNQTKQGYIALMSRLVIDEKLPVRFMYKTVPEHLNDTGWRVFTGYEDELFLTEEAVNMIPIPLDSLMKIDDSLAPLLHYNAGTVWERTPDADGWERVYDYKIPAPAVDVEITNDVHVFDANKPKH